MHWWVLVCGPLLVVAVPRFDPTAILRNVRVPADAAVGSIIYRLRASDPTFDYPLAFDIEGKVTVASVDTLNCTRFNSVCQANVILMRKLEPGRFYDFRVTVSNGKQEMAIMDCSFRATNATTPIGDIFPGAPTLLMISESARRNKELGSLVAKGSPLREKSVLLELWGSPQFSLRQRLITEKDAEGTIILLGKLDYETKTVHHITILANDPYTQPETDTRNIAAWSLLISVIDEQDTPPVFTQAPPTTTLDPNLKPGDLVLVVKAEDGDRGKPRDIRYGLISEGNPFTPFFNLSEETGDLRLAKPLAEIMAISHSNTPILLDVVAEEVRSNPSEPPAQSSTVRLALIPPVPIGTNPHFSSQLYMASLDENAVPGTLLNISNAELLAQPGMVFTLNLRNNNGTFDISPGVVEGKTKFMIKVRDNALLDFEARHTVTCEIYAKELGDSSNLTASALLVVDLNDVNDNPPNFREEELIAEIPESADVGATVLKVTASDDDDSDKNIRYTRLFGPGSEFFAIDPETGIVTIKNAAGIDADQNSVMQFFVEAADDNGKGNKATATITVNLIDVNDEAPVFEKNVYEFIMSPDRRQFTVPAFITAHDSDVTTPNNEVHYELITAVENITLHTSTGELSINPVWNGNDIVILKARAYDGGVPRMWTECEIRVYPPEAKSRKMLFIVSGRNLNRGDLERDLSKIVGGQVGVDRIRPYSGNEEGAFDISNGDDKSVVETTVTYTSNTVIDVQRLHEILDRDRVKSDEIQKSSIGSLWWLLLVILLLILIALLILILCCICEGCPLYVAPKRRRKVTPDVEKLVVGQGVGHESKSVQVAEWYGRREAWTPEHRMVDAEVDSMRIHELERGSDRGGPKLRTQAQDAGRDQYYIREGNTDILRLITRGGEQQQQRPVTLIQDQAYLIDSGKDILMRRFIDQQQGELRTTAYHQNTLNRIQSEHELLEESLRQQNALLRQILLERERDLRLETQSLPAGTQTDQNVSTQTEPLYLRPPRRQTRSDNDASDGSDEEDYYIIKKRPKNVRQSGVRRKIRTPIQEESEIVEVAEKQTHADSARSRYGQTRTSILRKMKAESAKASRSKSSIKKEVLQEISDSLKNSESEGESQSPNMKQNSADSNIQTEPQHHETEYYSDSLENVSPESETYSGKETRRKSENDISYNLIPENNLSKSFSQRTITKEKRTNSALSVASNQGKPKTKPVPRYMEWYNKNGNAKQNGVKNVNVKKDKPKAKPREDIKPTATKVSKRLLRETKSSKQKKIELPTAPGPEHPLIQHSKNRFEVTLPKRIEEDGDSGIALTRPAMAQKKSVFTIAYDDMQTRQLPESVATTP